MFILSIVIIFGLVCAIEYSALFLERGQIYKPSKIRISLVFILCILTSYMIILTSKFQFVMINELTDAHFLISLLTSIMVTIGLRLVLHMKGFKALCHAETVRKYANVFAVIILIAVIFELFLFNFRHYESTFNRPNSLLDTYVGSGLSSDGTGGYVVLEDGEKCFKIVKINGPVQNLRLDIRYSDDKKESVNVKIEAQDEGTSAYYTLSHRDIFHEIERSQYLRLHLYGDAKKIKILINAIPGDVVYLDGLELNAHVPLQISLARLGLVVVLLSLGYLLRPRSSLYGIKFDMTSFSQKLMIGIFILLQIIVLWRLVTLNPAFEKVDIPHHLQYHRLTEAILQGRVYLNEEPSPELKKLPNPYDPSLRKENKVRFLWDHAYYQGKYYVYFGIGPVLIYYLPYFFVTGTHMPTYFGVFWSCVFAAIGIMVLVGAIIQRWFKRTPFLIYLILSSYIINGCGLLYMAKRPDYYNITIALGLAFSCIGLAAWMLASLGERPSKTYLLIGSLCMAMVATCRPQMLLGAFLAIPILYEIVFKRRQLFSKKSIWSTTLFILPFIVVALGLMYYNAVRFGSVLDFGANYNLTVNDMTKRGWVFDRTFLGIVAYLFQPFAFQTNFPFLRVHGLYTSYMGHTILENPIGGVFYTNLLTLFALTVYPLRRFIKHREAVAFSLQCLLFSLIIVIVDTQMGGIMMRYLSDFSWLIFLSALIVILTIESKVEHELLKNYWHFGIVVCYFLSLGYHFFETFIDVSFDLISKEPLMSAMVSYLIQFWI